MSTYKHPLAPVLTILLTLGLVDAWAGRRSFFGGDSVSYLDMASGIANGDFWSAVNGHYGPLYPILVAELPVHSNQIQVSNLPPFAHSTS